MGCTYSTHVEMRSAYKMLVWKREGKRTLRRPMHRWKDIVASIYTTRQRADMKDEVRWDQKLNSNVYIL